MTAEEIRALYVVTLARADFSADREGMSWDQAPPHLRQVFLDACGHLVDALAEAGLLPTRMEENGALPVHRDDDETIAYWLAGRRRYLTEWQPIEAEVTDVG